MDPILEGLVTTTNGDGSMHFAPMGPRVDPQWRHLVLRPFPTSHTFQNLRVHGEGVLHVTDDVYLLARAALGTAEAPAQRPAERVNGFVLQDACRYYEFKVRTCDESGERVQINAEIVHAGVIREFWGFNRAKHAVLEAAILATRLHILPLEEVAEDYRKLKIIVEKTGAQREHDAFAYLQAFLEHFRETQRPR